MIGVEEMQGKDMGCGRECEGGTGKGLVEELWGGKEV